jgi:membrane fusion protein (multidrug efflux system)
MTASENPAKPAITPKAMAALGAGGIAALTIAAYWGMAGRYEESTENASVEGNIVQISPQTTGTVVGIKADNTDMVQAGQPLVALNAADAQLALDRAEAQLARVVRQVRGQFAMAAQNQSTVALRRAELARAQADLERRRDLAKTGAISAEDLRHAQDSVAMAQASLAAAGQQFADNQALIDNVALAQHPDVLAAASQVEEASLALARTQLRAPVSGMVTRRNVQLGQRVSPGAPLVSIVPLDHLWATANFMEGQLAHLRVGQKVTMHADVYGRSVSFTGHVLGLDAGTGSAFSVIPAQNATGNWIKVSQRVPVRIALDKMAAPLRLGLSMKVTVDTHERGGLPLDTAKSSRPTAYQTAIYDEEVKGARQRIDQIIAKNLGAAAR